MLKEAIEKIIYLAKPNHQEINGLQYSDKKLNCIMPPQQDFLSASTLTGIVDYIKLNKDVISLNKTIVHVIDHERVEVISSINIKTKEREEFLAASFDEFYCNLKPGFNYNANELIVKLRTNFVQTKTIESAIEILKSTANKEPANYMTLQPYSTFLEIEQPERLFLLNIIKDKGAQTLYTLESVDGPMWKLEAIKKIKTYLDEKLEELKIAIIA